MGEPLQLGSRVRLKVDDIAAGGEAVGRLDNFVYFVSQGAPGDELEVEITDLRKTFARARINKIITPSRRRITPPCPVYNQCGGCQFQHIDYDAQLYYKTKIVKDSLQHLTGLGDSVKVHPCKRLEEPWHYRNKVQAVVAAKPYLNSKERISHVVGLYAQGTHRVVKIDECLIQDELNNRILQASREAMERLQWPVYDERNGEGLIRYLVTRASLSHREALLVLVAAQPRLPQVQEFLNHVKRRVPQLKGVLLNLNPHQTNVVLGNRTQVLWGKDHLIEEVAGIKYQISPTSFFQVNTRGLITMCDILDQYCDLRPKDSVVDLYCGVGSLSLFMARKAKRVMGVDISQAAIEDAVVNSDLNHFKNTDFIAGASEKILPQLYRQGQRFQLALLDPPRKGCDTEVLQVLARMRIPRVVYVSCNPSSLARDLEILKGLGYQVHEIQPLDMFPQTYHVECVARLSLTGESKGR